MRIIPTKTTIAVPYGIMRGKEKALHSSCVVEYFCSFQEGWHYVRPSCLFCAAYPYKNNSDVFINFASKRVQSSSLGLPSLSKVKIAKAGLIDQESYEFSQKLIKHL